MGNVRTVIAGVVGRYATANIEMLRWVVGRNWKIGNQAGLPLATADYSWHNKSALRMFTAIIWLFPILSRIPCYTCCRSSLYSARFLYIERRTSRVIFYQPTPRFHQRGRIYPHWRTKCDRDSSAWCISQWSYTDDNDRFLFCCKVPVQIALCALPFGNITDHRHRLPAVSLRNRFDRWRFVYVVYSPYSAKTIYIIW